MKESPTCTGVEKGKIINALKNNIRELQQGIDNHCCLVACLMEERIDEDRPRPPRPLCCRAPRELRLENAIKEAIDILEESRKAFKSKRLEALRKRLTQVLIDQN